MVSTSEEYFFLISLEVLWSKIRPNKRSDRTIYPIQDEHRRINSECKSVRKSNYSKKRPIAADQMLSHVTQKWSCWWLWFPPGQEAELVTLLGPSVGVGESMGSSRGFVGRVSPLGVWDSCLQQSWWWGIGGAIQTEIFPKANLPSPQLCLGNEMSFIAESAAIVLLWAIK